MRRCRALLQGSSTVPPIPREWFHRVPLGLVRYRRWNPDKHHRVPFSPQAEVPSAARRSGKGSIPHPAFAIPVPPAEGRGDARSSRRAGGCPRAEGAFCLSYSATHTLNCFAYNRAYNPFRATSSSWVPSSTIRPSASTTSRSAAITVLSRWAITSVVRPSIRCSRAS